MSKEQESIIKFPCQFPIKAMGNVTMARDFKQIVVAIVRAEYPDLNEGHVTLRHSKNGKYLAVTVTIEATSQAQLDAIYQKLSDCEHVIMAL
ncbi:Proposed lipoate regulatory protein YbeD [hydrothermal vent metagenome]|uniref:Proposed lipoate regulatory protein YbeD n=1 Tax=hydrothermal vent metagenome TaxID=652676 RepID=A0A3B0YVM8_9ZZZZ